MFQSPQSLLQASQRALTSCCRRLHSPHSQLSRRFKTSQANAAIQPVTEADTRAYYDKAAHYRQLWGENIHIGYYEHVNDGRRTSAALCDWEAAQTELTLRMANMVDITPESNVIDLGCGFGKPAIDVASHFGCRMVGVDLSPKNIEVCNEILSEMPKSIRQRCAFEEGSFTNLSGGVTKYAPYSHAITIEAIYHVASQLDGVLANVRGVLEDGGRFINCDFLRSAAGPSPAVCEHFYQRLKLDSLVSTSEMMQGLCEHGFLVDQFEDWSDHAVVGYQQLMEKAQEAGDAELAEHYRHTWMAFDSRDLLMACVVAVKR